MKKQIYLSLVLVLFSFLNLQVLAQSVEYYQFKLERETKIRGSKIFYEGLKNNGDESQIDVGKMAEDYLGFYFNTYSGIKKKKIQNHISWMTNQRFEKAKDKASADVIVGGYYIIKTGANVEEKLFYERAQNVGGSIPFYEIRQTNRAEVTAVISYTYKDNSVAYDTINCAFEYERKPKTKYKSIDDLLAKCKKSLETELYNTFKFYSYDYVWYNFKSVKTKDKELKAELKTVKDLLNNGKIKDAGSIYLRVYELDHKNLAAAFNVAQCYELLGNYPKANEFYLKSPDFHAKVRMKSNMKLFEYLNNIGAKMEIEDF